MPKFLLLYVNFAALLQRYEFFAKLPNFFAIILQKNSEVTQLLTYSLLTSDLSQILE